MRKVNKNEKFELKLLITCAHHCLSFSLSLSLSLIVFFLLFKIKVLKKIKNFLLRTYKRTLS